MWHKVLLEAFMIYWIKLRPRLSRLAALNLIWMESLFQTNLISCLCLSSQYHFGSLLNMVGIHKDNTRHTRFYLDWSTLQSWLIPFPVAAALISDKDGFRKRSLCSCKVVSSNYIVDFTVSNAIPQLWRVLEMGCVLNSSDCCAVQSSRIAYGHFSLIGTHARHQ